MESSPLVVLSSVLQDENIGQISKWLCNQTGQANLFVVVINSKAKEFAMDLHRPS
jgi:hypothetical protein